MDSVKRLLWLTFPRPASPTSLASVLCHTISYHTCTSPQSTTSPALPALVLKVPFYRHTPSKRASTHEARRGARLHFSPSLSTHRARVISGLPGWGLPCWVCSSDPGSLAHRNSLLSTTRIIKRQSHPFSPAYSFSPPSCYLCAIGTCHIPNIFLALLARV